VLYGADARAKLRSHCRFLGIREKGEAIGAVMMGRAMAKIGMWDGRLACPRRKRPCAA
jgi:hypothetical protein